MEELLSIKNLSVTFNTISGQLHAVRGVSLSVNRGEIFALVGESGCGKTVTSQSILRLNPEPQTTTHADELRLGGVDLLAANAKQLRELRGQQCGMVFQDPMSSLNPTMRVGEQITEVLRRQGVGKAARMQEAVRLLSLLQIPEPELRARQYPAQLSGGMRQRVMIAMALAASPALLIADEPTVSLDVTVQLELLRLLRSISRERQMSVLLISHDMSVVASLADRVAVMYAGRIVEQGSATQLFAAPAHPYTRGLLASIPEYNKSTKLYAIPGTPPQLTAPPTSCAFFQRCTDRMQVCLEQSPTPSAVAEGHYCECWLNHPDCPHQAGGSV